MQSLTAKSYRHCKWKLMMPQNQNHIRKLKKIKTTMLKPHRKFQQSALHKNITPMSSCKLCRQKTCLCRSYPSVTIGINKVNMTDKQIASTGRKFV